MVSPVLNEHWYSGGFLVSEANNYLSRDAGSIANAGTVDLILDGGLVLAPALGTVTAAPVPGIHGNGSISALAEGPDFVTGRYTLTAQSATVFNVTDPNGDAMPLANVGTAYVDNQIGFTINAGTTAYAVGDSFTLSVPPEAGAWVPYSTTSLPAAAVLFNYTVIPAGTSKAVTVVSRTAEVNSAELQWDASILNAGTAEAGLQAAALASLANNHIIAR